MKNILEKKQYFLVLFALALLLPAVARANLELDAITFDPAIIASGDEVDIVVQFHHAQSLINEQRINDPRYTFSVELQPDDELTKKWVRIDDAQGNSVRGIVLSGNGYNKVFRVKVSPMAPPGTYEFKLIGQWYVDGVPTNDEQYILFTMPVKKEGIVMDIATYDTTPADVRAADTYVEIRTFIENSGEKDAKRVSVELDLPKGITSSYTNDNRAWLGLIAAGTKQELTSVVDVTRDVQPGVYNLTYIFTYEDDDGNEYTKTQRIPFLIRKSPYLEVTTKTAQARAGSDMDVFVTVKNTGSESAEAVDVRLLPQSSQPFLLDVRSQFIGELEPGEQRDAHFTFGVSRSARQGEHDIAVLLRAKGDSDEGDSTIYTFSRHIPVTVSGVARSALIYVGLGAFVIVLAILLWRMKK